MCTAVGSARAVLRRLWTATDSVRANGCRQRVPAYFNRCVSTTSLSCPYERAPGAICGVSFMGDKEERGHRTDVENGRKFGFLIDIHLVDIDFSVIFFGDALEMRCQWPWQGPHQVA